MKKMSRKPMVGLLLAAFTMSFVVTPSIAEAAWSDDSAALEEDTSITPYLVVGGLLIGGLLVYMIVKHSSSKEDSASEKAKGIGMVDKSMNFSAERDCAVASGATSFASISPPKAIPLHLYLDVAENAGKGSVRISSPGLSDVTVRAGISVGF